MKISVTGHRPHKLGNEYPTKDGYSGPCTEFLIDEINSYLVTKEPTQVITGMALGADQIFAIQAIKLGIPVIAAIPCRNHEKRWNRECQTLYHKILKDPLVTSVLVTDAEYSPSLMQVRNVFMMDKADEVLAIWDGSSGGTHNAIIYAREIKKPIHYINPNNWPTAHRASADVKLRDLFGEDDTIPL